MTTRTKKSVRYQARLKKNMIRHPYGSRKVYKKGTVIWECSESDFLSVTKKNIHTRTSLGIVEGHGVMADFDLDDIEFIRIETICTVKSRKVKLK